MTHRVEGSRFRLITIEGEVMNKKHVIGYPVAVILAMTIGAAGASGSSTAPVAAKPVPAVTVTVPGPAPAPVVKTVNKTPNSCIEALDLADTGFALAGEALTAASKGFTAVSKGDLAGLQAASEDMTTTSDKIDPAPYNAAKAECRATS